jgi:hypothetical protein
LFVGPEFSIGTDSEANQFSTDFETMALAHLDTFLCFLTMIPSDPFTNSYYCSRSFSLRAQTRKIVLFSIFYYSRS